MLELGLMILLSYIVGSIPTSIIVSKLKSGIDIRKFGSGNAGGTNVIRVLGWKTGVFVIIFDILKGFIATSIIARLYFDSTLPFNNRTPFEDFTVLQIIAGSAAVLGHIWTAFAGFKGGKGIATAGGMFLGIAPVEVLVSLIIFMIVFVMSRYVSLGSLSAAIAFPLTMVVRVNIFNVEIAGYHTLIFFIIGISLLVIFTHRANIKRLIEGSENRLTHFRNSHRKGDRAHP
jgi:glycerol-3-phosphate acyltransferase PlsY